MKNLYPAILFTLLIVNCQGVMRAQDITVKPDQIGLMKQFTGSWRCDIAADTTAFWDFRPFGTGLECYVRYVSHGKVFGELKSLYGYNKSFDKFIAAGIVKGMDMEIFAIWFKSERKYEIVSFSDISSPEKAVIKNEGEIISPGMLKVTRIVNNKPVNTLTYTRVE